MIEKILSELQEFPHGKYIDDYGKGFSAGINAAIEIVQEVAKEYGKDTNVRSNGWIPCSERLPEQNGWYLVTNELGVVQQQYWGASRWQKLRDDAVIAWQPLPKAYQKGE